MNNAAEDFFRRLHRLDSSPVQAGGVPTLAFDLRYGAIWGRCPLVMVPAILAAAVLTGWLWYTDGLRTALPWLVGFVLVDGLRFGAYRLFRDRAEGERSRKFLLTLSTALSGTLWGIAFTVYTDATGTGLAVIMMALLIAVAGSAVIAAGAVFSLALAFVVPALLLPALAFIGNGGSNGAQVAMLLLGSLVVALWACRRIEQLSLEAMRLSRENVLMEAETAARTYHSVRNRELLDYLLEGTDASLVVLDRDLRLLVWNSRFTQQCRDIGLALEQGLPYGELIRAINRAGGQEGQDEAQVLERYVERLRTSRGQNPVRDEYTHFDGRVFEIHGWRTGDGCWVLTYTNVTDGRKAAAEAVIHMSHHDSLTGLPNRARLHRELARAIVRAREGSRHVGVLVVDINDFKSVNDTQGHEIGDALLVEVGRCLSETAGPGAVVARFAADEFAVIFPASSVKEIDEAGRALLGAVKTTRIIKDRTIRVAASIGMACYPKDGDNPERLLRSANVALHRAQREGRDTLMHYEGSMFLEAEARAQFEHDILYSLDNNHFMLHFQPQIDLATNQLVGVESLLRWHHPERGWISPASVVAVAELSKLIIPLSERLLEAACRQAVQWTNSGLPPFLVAFNLSPLHIKEGRVESFVRRILEETGLEANRLELEITETAMASDSAKVLDTLADLDALGVTLAIDDFGTGYSSMSYLRQLPVDIIKIDRSFVAELTTDESAAAIVETVINLAHTLGLKVTAEGIETHEQLTRLKELGCDFGQGYLIARPMAGDALADWVCNREWRQVNDPGTFSPKAVSGL